MNKINQCGNSAYMCQLLKWKKMICMVRGTNRLGPAISFTSPIGINKIPLVECDSSISLTQFQKYINETKTEIEINASKAKE